MRLKFTLLDLISAFNEYSAGSIRHIDELTEELKKENFIYLKAIQEFIFFFIDEYINEYLIETHEKHLKELYEQYKLYYSKSYDVKAYGQECDASTADPVILKGIIAADEEELSEKVRKRAWNEGGIFNLVHYDILNTEDDNDEQESSN